MISIEEQIDRLKADANWLFDSVREYHRTAHGSDTQETGLWAVAERIEKAADMLLALKARAEAAEKDAAALRKSYPVDLDMDAALRRAEAAERRIAELETALAQPDPDIGRGGGSVYWKDRAEAAEKRVDELEARIRVMERDHGIDLSLAASRAEAAEEQLAAMEYEYRNTEPI